MPRKCSVLACNSNYRRGQKIRVYAFPNDPVERQKWIDVLPMPNRATNEVTKWMGVCANHWHPGAPMKRKSRFPSPAIPPDRWMDPNTRTWSDSWTPSDSVKNPIAPDTDSDSDKKWSDSNCSEQKTQFAILPDTDRSPNSLPPACSSSAIPFLNWPDSIRPTPVLPTPKPKKNKRKAKTPSYRHTLVNPSTNDLSSSSNHNPNNHDIDVKAIFYNNDILRVDSSNNNVNFSDHCQNQDIIDVKPFFLNKDLLTEDSSINDLSDQNRCQDVDVKPIFLNKDLFENTETVRSKAFKDCFVEEICSHGVGGVVSNSEFFLHSHARIGMVHSHSLYFKFFEMVGESTVKSLKFEGYFGIKHIPHRNFSDGIIKRWSELKKVIRFYTSNSNCEPEDEESGPSYKSSTFQEFIERQIQLINTS